MARLVDRGFPLKQASLDSVHEKNVRHGHISTLHIWPARRPLAASRAAIIATLLPDPGTEEERKRLLERLGGRVVTKVRLRKLPDGRVEHQEIEETEGGILHWGREQGPDLAWFRERIREAFSGQAPRVLDPFAGGGAIPLEAMRLGCQVVANDLNPVAWFILKGTLEYPQRLAGKRWRLPSFAMPPFQSGEGSAQPADVQAWRQAAKKGAAGQSGLVGGQPDQMDLFSPKGTEADLAGHVRYWGRWVLERARADLERFYPVVEGKPTVAYLWARTVTCKNCRATLPLLKTRWLCRKDQKRVLLTMEPKADRTGVAFGIEADVPQIRGNAAQRREHDRRLGAGTMSRAGATCPLCRAVMTMEDIRLEGQAGRLGAVMTAVVVDGPQGKEYRLPTEEEVRLAAAAADEVRRVFAEVPFGLPEEPTPKGGGGASRAFSVDGYGLNTWAKLFTLRQLLALGTFVKHTRAARDAMRAEEYPPEWVEAVSAYLAIAVDRLVDRLSTGCRWDSGYEKIANTFTRFAFPIVWDYAEGAPHSDTTGGYPGALEWVARYVEHALAAVAGAPTPTVLCRSATQLALEPVDAVVTDPPYYDAIPYAALMDFFYVWLRRTLHGLSPEIDAAFAAPLAPKWDDARQDGELIDDASRFGGDREASRRAYEEGMFRAFQACHRMLKPDGRMVIVFAHKQPDAWESLVSALIRAGFVVEASWPIQTEMGNRMRAMASAALSSSVWLVCRKRPADAPPGWDNRVLAAMREKLFGRWDEGKKEWAVPPRLREFWDAGIRGPDFVWAATGPALEAYSKHPVVKKANAPGEVMTVSDFLRHVRRLVVDFVVGRLLTRDGAEQVSGLDDVTTYYLLHRHDFGFADAPAGACILYAVSCGLSDRDLVERHDLLVRTGGRGGEDGDEGDEGEDNADAGETAGGDDSGAAGSSEASGTGSRFRLKPWQQRRRRSLGYDEEGRPAPLIDQVHRLMHLWRAGELGAVEEYVEERGLRRNALFHQLLQALVELVRSSPSDGAELSLLESISNHLNGRRSASPRQQMRQEALGVLPEGEGGK